VAKPTVRYGRDDRGEWELRGNVFTVHGQMTRVRADERSNGAARGASSCADAVG
jgi:hypothetical protein